VPFAAPPMPPPSPAAPQQITIELQDRMTEKTKGKEKKRNTQRHQEAYNKHKRKHKKYRKRTSRHSVHLSLSLCLFLCWTLSHLYLFSCQSIHLRQHQYLRSSTCGELPPIMSSTSRQDSESSGADEFGAGADRRAVALNMTRLKSSRHTQSSIVLQKVSLVLMHFLPFFFLSLFLLNACRSLPFRDPRTRRRRHSYGRFLLPLRPVPLRRRSTTST
jgi:type IV secretory pathway VirB10-like protein